MAPDYKPHRLRNDDPFRLQCPLGHSHWEPIDGHFLCRECETWRGEGHFELVIDARTGERLDREDVRELEQQMQRVGSD